jgi:hypothetical protein
LNFCVRAGSAKANAIVADSALQPARELTRAGAQEDGANVRNLLASQGKQIQINLFKRQYGKLKDITQKAQEDYSSVNIEDLLLSLGVEFRNPEKVPGGWLPLEAYDDREFDTRIAVDWIKKKGAIPKEGVGAQGLWKDTDGLCYWRKLRVKKYLPKSERYEGFWENSQEVCRLSRIYICFNEEDPRIFARRFK